MRPPSPIPATVHGHKFSPDNWERLVSDDRRKLLDPERMLDEIGIRERMTVADLGAGPGFFTFPLAARVGPAGTVYATDVSAAMLEVLRGRGLPPNVKTIHAEENRFAIPDAAVDVALLAFVFHELTHPADFLAEVRRVLRPDGRLALLEWLPKQEEIGPPLHERLSADRTTALLVENGFQVLEAGEANRSQYYIISSMMN